MTESFRAFVNARVSLSQADWRRLESVMSPQHWPAGSLLLESGRVCRHLYFLESGLLRFSEWSHEVEKTKFFAVPGEIFTSQLSFSQQAPAREQIEALLPSHTFSISYEEQQALYDVIPAWSRLIRLVIQEVNGWMEALLIESQTRSAEQRYRELLEEEGHWAGKVPLKYLASYLGIAPESLSRIRKKMLEQEKT
jgi:CRP-like cAMP-binding protein